MCAQIEQNIAPRNESRRVREHRRRRSLVRDTVAAIMPSATTLHQLSGIPSGLPEAVFPVWT